MLTSGVLNFPKLKKIWHQYAYLPGISTTQATLHLAIIFTIIVGVISIFSVPSEYLAYQKNIAIENTPTVTSERCDGC